LGEKGDVGKERWRRKGERMQILNNFLKIYPFLQNK
jgi:hypothetical protein